VADKVLNSKLWGMKVSYWVVGAFGTLALGLLTIIVQSSYEGQYAMGQLTTTVQTFEGTVIEFKEVLKEYRMDSIEVRQMAEKNKLQVEILGDKCVAFDEDIDVLSKRLMRHEAQEK